MTANFPATQRPRGVVKPAIEERSKAIADGIFQATHLDPTLDSVAVHELARLVAYAEAVDADVERRGLTTGSGGLRASARMRTEISRAIASWTSLLGANPKSRAEIVGALREATGPTFAQSYERRLREVRARSGDASGG